MCVRIYHCAQLLYSIQHSTVLIIFPRNLQIIIIAQMLPV